MSKNTPSLRERTSNITSRLDAPEADPVSGAAPSEALPPAEAVAPIRRRTSAFPVVGLMVHGEAMAQRDEEIESLRAKVEESKGAHEIEIDLIDPNPHQPRIKFDEEEIEALAANIKAVGLQQPVVLRPGENGRYILVGGDRRLRACRLLGWSRILAVVKGTDDAQTSADDPERLAALRSLSENLLRVDLSDYEKFRSYRDFIAKRFVSTQKELAGMLGISESLFSFIKKYGKLPAPVIAALDKNPALFGSNTALALAKFCDDGQEARVCEAIAMLAQGSLKSEAAAVEWVRKRLRKAAAPGRTFVSHGGQPQFELHSTRRAVTVTLPKGGSPALLAKAVEEFEALLERLSKEGGDAS